jgi:hypothetical protein
MSAYIACSLADGSRSPRDRRKAGLASATGKAVWQEMQVVP